MSKRARVHRLSTSESEFDNDLDVPSYSKAPHLDPSASDAPLFCNLAPTCNITPTPLANTRELEAHYARAHAHVCAAQGCAKVFPDARLLQLHHTENHDTLATMRKERGEKIFACHVASCPKLCATPKSRRMHLIEAHGYPKEYFFAVTNKGIGGLLQRWGDGATMLRGEWKPREGQQGWREDAKDDSDDDSPGVNIAAETDAIAGAGNGPKAQRSVRFRSPTSPGFPPASSPPMAPEPTPSLGDGVDALARELSNMSVSLVPRGVRFGRGGARGGFANGQNGQSHVQQGANKGKNGRPAPAPASALEPGAVTIQTREKAGANTKATSDNAKGKDKAAGSNNSPSAQTQGGKTGNAAKAKGPGPKSPPKANSKPAIPAPAPATATSPPPTAPVVTELDAMEEDASDAEPNGMSPEPGEDGEKKRTRRTNRGGRGRARRKRAAQGATGSSEAGAVAEAMQE